MAARLPTQLKLLVSYAVVFCILRTASCDDKKKVVTVKVPEVIKHIHHMHFKPVHIHKVHHQKKDHHLTHDKKEPDGESGWESRVHETPHQMTPPAAHHASEDHMLDSHEYGRESFWQDEGGSAPSQGKGRRQPNWSDSHNEPSKRSNLRVPMRMNRVQSDYGENWEMYEELPGRGEGLKLRGEKETLDKGNKKNGQEVSWSSNQEVGWKPITTDYSHGNGGRASRGRERVKLEHQYNNSGGTANGEDQGYHQTKERRLNKWKKKEEKKPKWSKQIKENEAISEKDMTSIIELLLREQYQQQIPQQIQPQQQYKDDSVQQQRQFPPEQNVQQQHQHQFQPEKPTLQLQQNKEYYIQQQHHLPSEKTVKLQQQHQEHHQFTPEHTAVQLPQQHRQIVPEHSALQLPQQRQEFRQIVPEHSALQLPQQHQEHRQIVPEHSALQLPQQRQEFRKIVPEQSALPLPQQHQEHRQFTSEHTAVQLPQQHQEHRQIMPEHSAVQLQQQRQEFRQIVPEHSALQLPQQRQEHRQFTPGHAAVQLHQQHQDHRQIVPEHSALQLQQPSQEHRQIPPEHTAVQLHQQQKETSTTHQHELPLEQSTLQLPQQPGSVQQLRQFPPEATAVQQRQPHQQQVHPTIQQPAYQANPIVLPILTQFQTQHVSQAHLPHSLLPIQEKKPVNLVEPQQWTSPLTTHSPSMVWSGHRLELPLTTMWHIQHHGVGSTSGIPEQVIYGDHPKPNNSPKLSIHPQIVASSPSQQQVLPPVGWPMNEKSQSGVKQKWEQSVQMSGRDGPASSYKVEVKHYSGGSSLT